MAPVCNVLHSAFEAVRLYINDQHITVNSSNYHLKSYILNTLTYSSIIKAAQLEAQGYYADIPGFFEKTEAPNSGFVARNKLFREGHKVNGAYKKEGTRFFGKLNLDLISCDSGLLPGTKVRIELDKAPSSFVLLKKASDTEQYVFKITDINLYVPVAQLSQQVFNQLNSIWSEQSLSIHYRKTEIKEVSLPKNKVEFFSDNLFMEDVPSRVIICFIQNVRKLGNYTNPFEFRRDWEFTAPGLEFMHRNREQFLEEKLDRLEKTLQLVLEGRSEFQSRGKGRGKKSSSFLDRFRSGPSTSSSVDPEDQDEPTEEQDLGATVHVHVKNVELLLNGSPLGKLDLKYLVIKYS